MRAHLSGVLDELCNSIGLIYAMVMLESIVLAVSITGLVVTDPSSPEHVVWLLNALGLGVLLGLSGTVVVLCFRR